MGGGQTVLVVLDGGDVREEAMRYALELAKRLQCAPVAVALLGERPAEQRDRSHPACADAERLAAGLGVKLPVALRYGDRASELLKHMAEQGPVRAVVWAGEPSALSSSRRAGRRHWLARLQPHLGCPIVTASARPSRPQP